LVEKNTQTHTLQIYTRNVVSVRIGPSLLFKHSDPQEIDELQ